MNDVRSDLKNGGETVHVILFASIEISVCLEKSNLMFECQEVGFLRAHCRQWASLAILARSIDHTPY